VLLVRRSIAGGRWSLGQLKPRPTPPPGADCLFGMLLQRPLVASADAHTPGNELPRALCAALLAPRSFEDRGPCHGIWLCSLQHGRYDLQQWYIYPGESTPQGATRLHCPIANPQVQVSFCPSRMIVVSATAAPLLLLAGARLVAGTPVAAAQLEERASRCNGDNLLNRFRNAKYAADATGFCRTFINLFAYETTTVSVASTP
jgi:hypothetical protein